MVKLSGWDGKYFAVKYTKLPPVSSKMGKRPFFIHIAAMAVAALATTTPNIVVLVLDDLDVELQSLAYMPKLKALISDQGATFDNFFAAVPVCCPSRSSLYSGLYQHGNHVTGNSVGANCSSKSWQAGPESRSFAVHLQEANLGYKTSFAGKYLNCYGGPNVGGVAHVPAGWTNWQGLVGNSVYYDYTISDNGVAEVHGNVYEADYLPDVILNKTLAFLDSVGSSPFLAMMSTPSCHGPADPAPQYADLFPGLKAPRTPAFNAEVKDSHWLQSVQAVYGLDSNSEDFLDLVYRRRLMTLQTVDDMVETVVAKLTAMGALENTWFIITSDNGYHLGQFGLIYDKRQPWNTDTHLPAIIRGPGVPAGVHMPQVTSMVDLSATILAIAGAPIPPAFDGVSLLPFLLDEAAAPPPRLAALVEYHGETADGGGGGPCARTETTNLFCNPDGNYTWPPYFYGDPLCVCQDAANNTYSCLRVIDPATSADYRYCEFVDTVRTVEYFDFVTDPYELVNAASSLPPASAKALSKRLGEVTACAGAVACNVLLTEPIVREDGSPLAIGGAAPLE
jgi:N-acetylglucosamine-6-sulfatase